MRLEDAISRIDEVPSTSFEPSEDNEVSDSIRYLASPEAEASLRADCYWPKWHSPWWHMRILHERGQATAIPKTAAYAMVEAMNRMPMKTFPVDAVPEGIDPMKDAFCHCALGAIVPVLERCGVDVDTELPWVRDWFGRYQLADGGLTCDFEAHTDRGDVPSSMVATIASLEALLVLTAKDPRPQDLAILDRAAAFLAGRGLVRGSESAQNADERTSALAWPKLTFPRFYFYDVLRGLEGLVAWALARTKPIAWSSVSEVVAALLERFPDGKVRIERRGFEGLKTRQYSEAEGWTRGHPQTRFPLLEASSVIGSPSPFLSARWRTAREGLLLLHRDGRLVGDGSG